MGVAVMTVLALAIVKAGQFYADCKIGIWLTVITVVVLAGWLVSAIFDKISLIPILFFLR